MAVMHLDILDIGIHEYMSIIHIFMISIHSYMNFETTCLIDDSSSDKVSLGGHKYNRYLCKEKMYLSFSHSYDLFP